MKQMQFDKTMEEVKRDMETRDNVLVLDVREEDEYSAGHIPGAICKPLSTLKHHVNEFIDIKKDIYVYCRSGQRSASACRILKEQGIPSVYNIGGMIHWPYDVKAGMDV